MFLGTNSTTAAASTSTSTGKAATDAKKLESDLNRFLTLLVTQLQHQNPLEPMDANQFTSQLVQFASVEQQINQNANLEKLVAAQKSGSFASSLGYLGTRVEGAGKGLPLQDGAAEGTYTLPQKAAEAIVTIKDAAGRTVYTAPVERSSGRHEFHWDGRSTDGKPLPDGAYAFEVAAKDATGAKLDVAQSYFGRVTGIADETSGTILDLGGSSMSVDDVVAIRENTAG